MKTEWISKKNKTGFKFSDRIQGDLQRRKCVFGFRLRVITTKKTTTTKNQRDENRMDPENKLFKQLTLVFYPFKTDFSNT